MPKTQVFTDVKVSYEEELGTLFIDDAETGEQLAIFYVTEED